MTTIPPVPSPRPAEEIRADQLIPEPQTLSAVFGPEIEEWFAAQHRLAADVEPLLADRERLSAELADAQAENERLRGELAGKERTITAELSMKTLMSRKWDEDRQAWSETIGELAAAERALEAVRAVIRDIESECPDADQARSQWWEAMDAVRTELRAALSAASPTTSDDEERGAPGPCCDCERGCVMEGGPCGVPAASDEPARCPHGHTEGHRYSRDGVYVTSWCPGSAASGTPETTR